MERLKPCSVDPAVYAAFAYRALIGKFVDIGTVELEVFPFFVWLSKEFPILDKVHADADLEKNDVVAKHDIPRRTKRLFYGTVVSRPITPDLADAFQAFFRGIPDAVIAHILKYTFPVAPVEGIEKILYVL